jgi:DNA uptake protein ComE-like DNA-binding protein
VSKNNWFEQIPSWIWISFIPIFGGIAHIYAGWKGKKKPWMVWGSGFIAGSIIISSLSPQLNLLVWIGQIITAFMFRREYLITTAPKGVLIPSSQVALLMAEKKGQIDINQCTKDEMVYDLGLSIVYANDIELMRNEGYVFTDINELSDIVGIPESTLRRIEPLIVFRYYDHKEVSWQRLNSLSVEELINHGIEPANAEKIVAERTNRGTYKSLVDVRKRTGIPISVYQHLV